MKNLTELIREDASINGLKPIFYFNNMDFFETITDTEQQKFLTASYKRVNNNLFVYFYYKQKQIGYLRLKKINPYL